MGNMVGQWEGGGTHAHTPIKIKILLINFEMICYKKTDLRKKF